MKNRRALCLILCVLFALSLATPAFAQALPFAAPKATAPTAVALNASARTILPGGFYKLKATVKPSKAPKAVTWLSSDPSIATVDASGLVIAKAQGSCTVSATTADGSKSAQCAVTVGYAYGTTKVRFFGVANSKYKRASRLASPKYDLGFLMNDVYGHARFQNNKVKMYKKQDLSGNGMRSMLKKMATDYSIKQTDVTIFYYSGHGLASNRAANRGALCGVDTGINASGIVTVEEVRKYLDKVPGTVIVILDSCLSGQYVQSKSGELVSEAGGDPGAFTDAWVSELSRSTADNFVVNKALTDSTKNHKYKILAACAPMESSWLNGLPYGGYIAPLSLFTYAFWMGADPYQPSAGSPVIMEADKNGDHQVSMAELYNYAVPEVNKLMADLIEEMGDVDPSDDLDSSTTQTITVWPQNDPFPLVSYS